MFVFLLGTQTSFYANTDPIKSKNVTHHIKSWIKSRVGFAP